MNSFEKCVNRQKRIDRVVNDIGYKDIIERNLLVKEKVINANHYIVMLGETSSGKSALINSIFNNKILVESVKPTTGIVTEVIISEDENESLLAVKKDKTFKNIDKEDFNSLSVSPIDNIQRLRYVGKCKDDKYSGMRIFDTPGYGSIVDYHEEVLKGFISESDIIVYVVSYKVGIGDDDLQFLKYVREIIGKRVEVVLAINMCPKDIKEDNKRVGEIKRSVKECIDKEFKTFYIESNSEKNPDAKELWDYIYNKVNDSEEQEELAQTLKSYQDYILKECKIKVNSKIASIEAKKEDIEDRMNMAKELLVKKEDFIETIERGFTKIKVKSIKFIDKSAVTIKNSINEYINDEDKWSKKEEAFTLMQHYYIPKLTKEETDNLINYIEDEIVLLDREIQNILTDVISNLEGKFGANNNYYTDVIDGIIKKHIGDAVQSAAGEILRRVKTTENIDENTNSLEYSRSKNFKKLGEISEEKHLKQSYYNLREFIKVISATSIKAITKYLSVFTDSIFYLYDALTWQKKIDEISIQAINNWASDMEWAIKKYLEQLKDRNKEEIILLFNELNDEFNQDEKELKDIGGEELIRLQKEIDFILNKCLLISL